MSTLHLTILLQVRVEVFSKRPRSVRVVRVFFNYSLTEIEIDNMVLAEKFLLLGVRLALDTTNLWIAFSIMLVVTISKTWPSAIPEDRE
jgi:hypothetical protein